jgi:hypothetical protein
MRRTVALVLVFAAVPLLVGCTAKPTTTIYPSTSSAAISTAVVTPATGDPGTTMPASTTTTERVTPTTVPISFDGASIFTAELSGAEVVPAVDTPATGSAIFKIDPTSTRAYFKLTLSNITDVIASRVHEGKPGVSGQGLLILYPGPTVSGPYTGVLAQGYFDSSVLIGSLTGRSLAEFAVLLQSGSAYVNVGTVRNPKGEIRGQIHEVTAPPDEQTE